MYETAVPTNINSLIGEVATFAANAGFVVVAQDTVTLTWSSPNTPGVGFIAPNIVPGSNYALASGLIWNAGAPALGSSATCSRIVVKDPSSPAYIHMLAYTGGQANREGILQATTAIDFYMSTDFNLSNPVDNHPGIVKLGAMVYLPSTFKQMHLFSGNTTKGEACVHITIEESLNVFTHFSFGTIEKYLDFTGGSYVTFSTHMAVNTTNANGIISHAYCSSGPQYGYRYFAIFYPNTIYAPDLDTANKGTFVDIPYRSFSGHNHNAATEGRTAYRAARGLSAMAVGLNGNEIAAVDFASGGVLSPGRLPLPNAWSGISPLLPIYLFSGDGIDTNYNSLIGHYPLVRSVNLLNVSNGDEYTLGADTWKLFPIRARTTELATYTYTGNLGFAIKK